MHWHVATSACVSFHTSYMSTYQLLLSLLFCFVVYVCECLLNMLNITTLCHSHLTDGVTEAQRG